MTEDSISRQAAIEAVGINTWAGQRLLKVPPVEPQWTPVTEGLPDPNKAEDACLVYYLIQNEYGDMMVAAYRSNRYGETWWEQMYHYGSVDDEVVAWMPLPKPWSNNVG